MKQFTVKLNVPKIGTISVTVGAINSSQAIIAAQAQYPGSTAKGHNREKLILLTPD